MDLSDYTLLFEDNFDALNLMSSTSLGWNTDYHYGDRFLHNERQVYVDPEYKNLGLNPFGVDQGVLTITAEHAPSNLVLPSGFDWSVQDSYTSGHLNSEEMFSVQYGYFEIRAQMPEGQGLWSSFGLYQSNGKWPGEYDVVEVLGENTGNLFYTKHEDIGGGQVDRTGGVAKMFDSADGFHTYGIDWQADGVTWYYDGVKVFETDNVVDDQAMHMFLNLAVGGWGGTPADSAFPAEMKIDYVRVYQKNVDHDVVGVPSAWHDIPLTVFSEISDFEGAPNYVMWEFSAALSDQYVRGTMMSDWTHELTGNDQDNLLIGSDGRFNQIDGGVGNDVLIGNDGADYFVLRNGDGNDVVMDFSYIAGNSDKLYLDGFHFTHFDDVLPFMEQAGDDILFRLDIDQAALLKNVRIEDLSAAQFVFVNSVAAPIDSPIVKAFQAPVGLVAPDAIDFTDEVLRSYMAQDSSPVGVYVSSDSLELNGNSWKSIDFDYTVSENTVLEFTFSSSAMGEIHGIALDHDNNQETGRAINIYGTQAWGQDGPDYVGDGSDQQFTINLSDYYVVGRTYNKMVFVTDDDADANANSVFSNVRVYESNGIYGGAFDDTIIGTVNSDYLYGDEGADVFLFESAKAYSAVDVIGDFDRGEGDRLDLSDLLSSFDPLSDAISDFVQISTVGKDSDVYIDANGGGDSFVQIATLLNSTGLEDEGALYIDGVLILS